MAVLSQQRSSVLVASFCCIETPSDRGVSDPLYG